MRETVGAWPAMRSAEARDLLFNALLLSAGTNSRALMMSGASSMSAASTTPTPTTTAPGGSASTWSAAQAMTTRTESLRVSTWDSWLNDKFGTAIVPFINQSYLPHQMILDVLANAEALDGAVVPPRDEVLRPLVGRHDVVTCQHRATACPRLDTTLVRALSASMSRFIWCSR